MKNTILKVALAAGALLLAAVPASAQSRGFGFNTDDGYGRTNGSYSDYGRGYGDRDRYGDYNRAYYSGYRHGGYSWRHHRSWDSRHRGWRHHYRDWD
jgi:opacity protein-like surface antigen